MESALVLRYRAITAQHSPINETNILTAPLQTMQTLQPNCFQRKELLRFTIDIPTNGSSVLFQDPF